MATDRHCFKKAVALALPDCWVILHPRSFVETDLDMTCDDETGKFQKLSSSCIPYKLMASTCADLVNLFSDPPSVASTSDKSSDKTVL